MNTHRHPPAVVTEQLGNWHHQAGVINAMLGAPLSLAIPSLLCNKCMSSKEQPHVDLDCTVLAQGVAVVALLRNGPVCAYRFRFSVFKNLHKDLH